MPTYPQAALADVWNNLDQFRSTPRPAGYPINVKHLFAPVDKVHDALVALCEAACHSLAAAMYGWDDDQIDDLFRAKLTDQNVPVILALDKTQAGGVHEKQILARWKPDVIGNAIVIGHSSKGAISHDKMIVIDGLITVCGSTNLSESGESKQNNECVIVNDPVFAIESRARIDMIHNEMHGQMVKAGTITS